MMKTPTFGPRFIPVHRPARSAALRHLGRLALATWFCASLGGCRQQDPPAPTGERPTVLSGSQSSPPRATSAPALSAGNDAGKPKALAYPTPSDHVFPKGPSDEVLCEAIHSKEQDLWRRFGHFIPLFINGIIWVGPGTEADVEPLQKAAAKYKPNLIRVDARACSRGGILAYAVGDWKRTPSGIAKEHLGKFYTVDELELIIDKREPQARRALEQRFLILQQDHRQQMYDACERDADYCDRVRRLVHPDGLCSDVWSEVIQRIDPPSAEHKAKCEQMANRDKVCAVLTTRLTSKEQRACEYRLLKAVGGDVSDIEHWGR